MKLKLKFDKKTILDFLLQNVEKIVLGIFALIFLLLLYSSLSSAARFEKTPDQLQSDTRTAKTAIDSTTYEDYKKVIEANLSTGGSPGGDSTTGMAGESPSAGSATTTVNHGLTITDYPTQATGSRVKIEEKPYALASVWNPPIFNPKTRRTAPPVLTVQELRAKAGMGAFRIVPVANDAAGRRARTARGDAAAAATAGTEQIRGQRWIVLTALVPFAKQEAAYNDTFRLADGYNQQTDYPTYLGYWVERVEVTGGDDEKPDWSKATKFISSKETASAIEQWSQQTRDNEIVAPQYIEQRLVFPLGPLVNRLWDANVAHEPKIPVQKASDRGMGGDMRGAGLGGGVRPGAGRMPGPMGAMPGPMGGERMGAGRMPGVMGARDGQPDTEGTEFGAEENAATRRDRADAAEEAVQDNRAPEYHLFRFFDFHVEPGKRYVYRVRLGLQNPNYGLKAPLLAKADLAAKKIIETPWSDPSPAVSVLRDTQVLLASVKPSRGEPSAEIIITTWLQRKGVEVYKDFTVTRGQVANYSDVTGKIAGGGTAEAARVAAPARPARGLGGGALDAMMGPGMPGMGRVAQPAAAPGGALKADFISDATAIDIRGGEKLFGVGRKSSNLTSGGQILILDAEGNVVLRDELDDEPIRDQLKPSRNAGEGPAGGMGPMMGPAGLGGGRALDALDGGKAGRPRAGRP
jgi:hypothetical protein